MVIERAETRGGIRGLFCRRLCVAAWCSALCASGCLISTKDYPLESRDGSSGVAGTTEGTRDAGGPSAVGDSGAAGDAGAGGNSTGGVTVSGGASAAGRGGTTAGGAGGSPAVVPPCAHAVDTVSPGYLELQSDSCYRTTETFDTIYCGGPGWVARTIKVNGQLAACNATQSFAPTIGGYNYFEIAGAPPGSDWLRWSRSTMPQNCWMPFAHDRCADFQIGDALSYNGRNWVCATADCKLCATKPACEPGGACPSGAVWADEGACQ